MHYNQKELYIVCKTHIDEIITEKIMHFKVPKY